MTNRDGLPCFAERGPVITTFCLSPDRHEAAQGKQHPYPKLVRCLGKSSRRAKRPTARACQSQGVVPELMSRQVLLTLRSSVPALPTSSSGCGWSQSHWDCSAGLVPAVRRSSWHHAVPHRCPLRGSFTLCISTQHTPYFLSVLLWSSFAQHLTRVGQNLERQQF